MYGTYIRSGNSQAIALQETKYTINALVLPEAMEIYYDFNRSGYRLHIESTSAYTGDDWLLSNSISVDVWSILAISFINLIFISLLFTYLNNLYIKSYYSLRRKEYVEKLCLYCRVG